MRVAIYFPSLTRVRESFLVPLGNGTQTIRKGKMKARLVLVPGLKEQCAATYALLSTLSQPVSGKFPLFAQLPIQEQFTPAHPTSELFATCKHEVSQKLPLVVLIGDSLTLEEFDLIGPLVPKHGRFFADAHSIKGGAAAAILRKRKRNWFQIEIGLRIGIHPYLAGLDPQIVIAVERPGSELISVLRAFIPSVGAEAEAVEV